ncbi:polyprenyl synthetase family protein [Candidatus Bathyarchaeota archaeon]|nr:polyprenyl synthetase family protein [Candidatus Bathyarchaeota archaeon]
MKSADEADLLLQKYGGQLERDTESFLTEGVKDDELLEPLRYMLGTRRDFLRPSIVSLACEASQGDPVGVPNVSIAISLVCHSMGVLDDLIDQTAIKRFVPTLPGKFGDGRAIIVAALVTAKAFQALSLLAGKVSPETFHNVNTDFQKFLSRMAVAEIKNSNLAKSSELSPEARLTLLELEGVDIETAARLGVMVGGRELHGIESLTQYGRYLGKAIRLREDLECSLNLTLELASKIRRRAIPYPLAWALSKSKQLESSLMMLTKDESPQADSVQKCIALLFDTGAVAHTKRLVREAAQKSIHALSKTENGRAKDALLTLALAQERLLLRALNPLSFGAR